MPSDTNRLTVPTLARGLHVVVKPCNLRRSPLFKEIAILAVPRGPCLRNPLLMTVRASLMSPTAPGRRFDATVPGPRRVVIKSGPTGGGRRCPRCSTLLKPWPRVRSSWSRSGSFNGAPRPDVAREPPFKKPFQRRGEFFVLDPGIVQCLLTQFAAAAPSRILPPHPQVWIRAAQPSGVRWERHSTARPLMRADTRPYFIAAIIQTSTPSAEPRFGMLRNPFQLLAPPSERSYYLWLSHACSRHINYWHQGANVLPVSLLTTPSEITRKIRPEKP
jgi:hypothetical protein